MREGANTVAEARWPCEQAREWYDRQAWPVGCNFLPSTAVNDVEMWQAETFDAETIDRELGWAEDIGFNSLRVFLQYVVWDGDPAGFLERFERFLEIADSHGMTTMPILFDDCTHAGYELHLGPQEDPLPGVHNSRWVPSPGKKIASDKGNWPRLEEYVRDVIGRFARDSRVIVWDLYNEPGACGEFDPKELLSASFDWAQDVRPDQPLTAGAWRGKLWEVELDTVKQEDELTAIMIDRADVISFHSYLGPEIAEAYIDNFATCDRPMFCTEWMARGPLGSTFQAVMPVWEREKIGCYNWGLVAGRTQTYIPWGNPSGELEPEMWHHDIFCKDGTPFDQAEIDAIRELTGK